MKLALILIVPFVFISILAGIPIVVLYGKLPGFMAITAILIFLMSTIFWIILMGKKIQTLEEQQSSNNQKEVKK